MAFSNSSPSQTLIPMLSSAAMAFFVILAMTNKAYSQDKPTSFTYDFYGSQPKTLTYQGDAFFPASGSTFLRLTKTDASGVPLPGSVGRVLHSSPVVFKTEGATASFETTVSFFITPKTGDNDPADGICFFIAPEGSTIPSGAAGSSLGVYTTSGTAPNIFAVEFDIYVNSAWDPSFRHIGINLGSRISSNVTRFEGVLGQQVTARINYEAATKIITVYATAVGGSFELSYPYDLTDLLNDKVQVGLASSTGEHVAIHDVVSWYFSSTLVQHNNNANNVGEINGDNIRQIV